MRRMPVWGRPVSKPHQRTIVRPPRNRAEFPRNADCSFVDGCPPSGDKATLRRRCVGLATSLRDAGAHISLWCAAVLLAACTAGMAAAQTSGTIEGTVVDAQGLAVSGAQVELSGEDAHRTACHGHAGGRVLPLPGARSRIL